jgi:hypothetical protein
MQLGMYVCWDFCVSYRPRAPFSRVFSARTDPCTVWRIRLHGKRTVSAKKHVANNGMFTRDTNFVSDDMNFVSDNMNFVSDDMNFVGRH